jgi:hypothetical protein
VVTLLAAVGVLASAAGCVSMPSAGPVLSYTITQGAGAQGQSVLQFVPPSPQPGWSPAQVVQGFLTAGASFAGNQEVARKYLTPAASAAWTPHWRTAVFKDGPNIVGDPGRPPAKQRTARVYVSGTVQATLSGEGTNYGAPSATPPKNGSVSFRYDLVQDRGQWRISNAHDNPLLLTSSEFQADFQLRNLYFFDPGDRYLVPDPVYVPLQATQGDLVNVLVEDLVNQPPDWLGDNDATHTAFPPKTALHGSVTVDGGTALVDLAGTAIAKASLTVRQRISAQLWWTLHGAGQGSQQVQSIALSIDGKPFVPPGAAPGNAIQNSATKYWPASGPQPASYYFRTASGGLWKATGTAKGAKVATLGAGYAPIAVSPDANFLATVKDGTVYTGPLGGKSLTPSLTPRFTGDDIASLSWDADDNLWMTSSAGIGVVPAVSGKQAGPAATVRIAHQRTCPDSDPGTITAVRVAPDGVRVAVVFGGATQTLAFAAIARLPQSQFGQSQVVSLQWSPFFVCGRGNAFSSVSWWGPDDVIALGQPGSTLTEYPVNGGSQVTIPNRPGIATITASKGGGLVASMADKSMAIDPTGVTGVWDPLGPGVSPAFPG